jgi:uncharacterized membrane protein YccF (DUF307 family)
MWLLLVLFVIVGVAAYRHWHSLSLLSQVLIVALEYLLAPDLSILKYYITPYGAFRKEFNKQSLDDSSS